MANIQCPKCGEVFNLDESSYAALLSQVKNAQFDKELKERSAEIAKSEKLNAQIKMNEAVAKKDEEIARLLEKLSKADEEKQRALKMAEMENEKNILKMRNELDSAKSALDLEKAAAAAATAGEKEKYEVQLAAKDDQIRQLRDYRQRLSTKMVGEDLERHCHEAFDRVRQMAFPNAYFEKDNKVEDGTKGDFVFRDFDEDGTEFISIMFEMKNEMADTESKHRNEDFFSKLDKDRKKKGCEYAVLVSTLEADSELYNEGIVDVSHRYEKMYVIRPQFFIPIISLLRNSARSSLSYRRQLAEVKRQSVDLTNFESEMEDFKRRFGKNYRLASESFQTAVDEIDKTISHLQKTKDSLLNSINNLRLANNKAEELTIKKLTKNSPALREMFDEAKRKAGDE